MSFSVKKNFSKEEKKSKRKTYFLNVYKKSKKNFFNEKNTNNLSILQKNLSKLVKIRVFHRNKVSRLVSKFSKQVV